MWEKTGAGRRARLIKNYLCYLSTLWAGLRIVFHFFLLRVQRGYNWVLIQWNRLLILGDIRRNILLFFYFPLHFYPSHWRGCGFESAVKRHRLKIRPPKNRAGGQVTVAPPGPLEYHHQEKNIQLFSSRCSFLESDTKLYNHVTTVGAFLTLEVQWICVVLKEIFLRD